MSTQHTPTPWATDGRWIVADNDGRPFASGQPFLADCLVSEDHAARGPENTKANAQFIVRAVNCHAELLEALQGLVAMYADVAPYGQSPLVELARAAIAKAKGETP